MRTFEVEVTQVIRVTLDDTKFDESFMEEFRQSFYDFDTIEQHAEHIAQLCARGLADPNWPNSFIEGYGEAKDMGISSEDVWQDQRVVSETPSDTLGEKA